MVIMRLISRCQASYINVVFLGLKCHLHVRGLHHTDSSGKHIGITLSTFLFDICSIAKLLIVAGRTTSFSNPLLAMHVALVAIGFES